MARKLTFEKIATAIHKRMKEPTAKQEEAIYRRVFSAGIINRTYRKKPIHYCSECGCEVQLNGQKTCPQCGVKWKAAPSDFERRQTAYHMEFEAKGDTQVTRFYRVDRWTQFGKKASWYVTEVERIMYAPNGERKVFARSVQCCSMYYDAWSYYTKMSIKRENKQMSESAKLRYNLSVYNYRIKSLTQQWQYKEIPALMTKFKNDTSVLRIVAYHWGETMIKTGQEHLFKHLAYFIKLLPKGTEHALNICTRNHYIVKDPSLWLDHLELLKYFKLDTHNAHYVCPKNLLLEHHELLMRKQREETRRAAIRYEQEERRRIEQSKQYKEMLENWPKKMGCILTLELKGKDLQIRPLQSIDEFREEGDAMHHCVYSMKYWDITKHPNTLILSAKDDKGNRLATIEYNMARHSIVQCRAVCNQVPERDAEIRKLITSHRKKIDALLHKEIKLKASTPATQPIAVAA